MSGTDAVFTHREVAAVVSRSVPRAVTELIAFLPKVLPWVFGDMAQIFLSGVIVPLAWTYAASPAWRASSRINRLVVGAVLALNTLATALSMHDIVFYTKALTNSREILTRSTQFSVLSPLIIGLVGVFTQWTLAARASSVRSFCCDGPRKVNLSLRR